MSYTVLARKWRPQNFNQLIGQEHVQRAIVNAIEQNRLHHAYLFTGTRGVGKTTIARIFSKCLNCESGITAEPCGECAICQEIEQGHFVDLLEIDAASRTKVEDTREILDNVQYRPSRGRYKVYLIDEVHMLSNSSFNALLKTLEEPPPHVVFLLATTDPQKLPITVLSRCLQFHLKRMAPEQIVAHLADILTKESIEFDHDSLKLIARAADGSMRDSLSLLDQAIAFGAGKLRYQEVSEMLGAVDQQFVCEFLLALAQNDAKAILDITERMAEFAPDYQAVLADIISSLHQIAVAQLVGTETLSDTRFQPLLEILTPEDVQLFYQLAIHARKDLPLAPDAREGFEMALLRILAFRPVSTSRNMSSQVARPETGNNRSALHQKAQAGSSTGLSGQKKNPSITEAVQSLESQQSEQSITVNKSEIHDDLLVSRHNKTNDMSLQHNKEQHQEHKPSAMDVRSKPLDSLEDSHSQVVQQTIVDKENTVNKLAETNRLRIEPSRDNQNFEVSRELAEDQTQNENLVVEDANHGEHQKDFIEVKDLNDLRDPYLWHDFIHQLELTGTVFQVLNNSCVTAVNGDQLKIALLPSVEHFCTETAIEKISQAVTSHLKRTVKLVFETGTEDTLTPRLISEQYQQQQLDKVLQEFQQNPKVESILSVFSAELSKEDILVNKRRIH
jgi:DNA polymerase-3 subunit gamma/tau